MLYLRAIFLLELFELRVQAGGFGVVTGGREAVAAL
jgi:hypothetical protein